MTEQTAPHIDTVREALAAAATLGTARRPFEPPRAAGALGAALAQIDLANGSERALLSAAAVVTSFERAGYAATRAPERVVPPAEEDPRPLCSPTAVAHLLLILNGKERALLPEWLRLLDETGKRAPARLLPDLLDAGKQTVELRPQLRATLGPRGQWLAAQHPDWHYARIAAATHSVTLEDVTETWQTGTHAARLALLHATRPVAPDVARELIASTWSTEKADERAAFLETLGDSLSVDDEPFLERVLDDRSRPVRKTAADLLSRLSDSRLVQRMIARVTPLLRWTPPGGSRLFGLVRGKSGSIEVTLPKTCDKAMVRDGIDPKPASETYSASDQATLLAQMLRAIPPSYWEAQWQATPEDILAAANGHAEHSGTLKSAWADATRINRDATWAEALLRIDPELHTLLLVLPVERQEALLLDVLKSTNEQQIAALALLRATRHQWSVALSRAALDVLVELFKRPPDRSYYVLTHTLNEIAYHFSPELVPEVDAVQLKPQTLHNNWHNATERLRNTLQFRHEMYQAFHS